MLFESKKSKECQKQGTRGAGFCHKLTEKKLNLLIWGYVFLYPGIGGFQPKSADILSKTRKSADLRVLFLYPEIGGFMGFDANIGGFQPKSADLLRRFFVSGDRRNLSF